MERMRYDNLYEYQKTIIANGCGGKGGKVTPPHATFFKEACNQHDLDYFIGHTEIDRFVADTRLWKAMRAKIGMMPVSHLRCLMLPYVDRVPDFLVKLLFRRWADLYLIGVRLVGWKFFHYDDEQQVLP